MKKRKSAIQQFLNIGVILYLIGITIFFMGGCKDTSSDLINSIKGDLPYGASFAEVESYLQKTKCEYSFDKETKTFTAIKRDVRKKTFTSQSISIIIKMDDHEKLKDLNIKVVHTGT